MANETELKYIPPDGFSAQALFDSEDIAPFRDGIKHIDMHTDYLDTRTGAAKQLGITLRRRFENGASVIYAKCSKSASGALSVRGEWSEVSNDIQNAAAILAKKGAPTGGLAGLALEICATVSFHRAECLVTPRSGFSFMLSYDEGRFGADTPFCEVELELVSGSTNELVLFGEGLAAKYVFSPEPRSKYARALAASVK